MASELVMPCHQDQPLPDQNGGECLVLVSSFQLSDEIKVALTAQGDVAHRCTVLLSDLELPSRYPIVPYLA
ncbi:hypothetical protein Plhal304r1_c003g0012481 [Plasmopara halstedii]